MEIRESVIKYNIDNYNNVINETEEELKNLKELSRLLNLCLSSKEEFVGDTNMLVNAKIETNENLLKITNSMVDMLQKECEHDFEYHANDSHYTYEKCKICGYLEKT